MTHDNAIIGATEHLDAEQLTRFTAAYQAVGVLVPRRLIPAAAERLAREAKALQDHDLELAWRMLGTVWTERLAFDDLVAQS